MGVSAIQGLLSTELNGRQSVSVHYILVVLLLRAVTLQHSIVLMIMMEQVQKHAQ